MIRRLLKILGSHLRNFTVPDRDALLSEEVPADAAAAAAAD